MLATLFALHLVLAAPAAQGGGTGQGAPSQEAGPEDWPYETPPRAKEPPAPSHSLRAAHVRAGAARLHPLGARDAAAVPRASLLSAEPLGGGSATLMWAGWSSLGIAWAQGLPRRATISARSPTSTGRERSCASAASTAARSALRVGSTSPVGSGSPGTRTSAAGGSTTTTTTTAASRSSPALVLSTRAIDGIISLLGEAPVTVTVGTT